MTFLLDNHREEIAAVCGRLGVERLDVFGSAVRGGFQFGRENVGVAEDCGAAQPADSRL